MSPRLPYIRPGWVSVDRRASAGFVATAPPTAVARGNALQKQYTNNLPVGDAHPLRSYDPAARPGRRVAFSDRFLERAMISDEQILASR